MNTRALVNLAAMPILIAAASLTSASVGVQQGAVRLAMVNVPDDVIRPLMPDFQKQSGRGVEIVYTGNDPFAVARAGKADLVIAHYGHEGVEPFVGGGYGLWPHPVFANAMALLGPPGDPARIRGLTDATEAFRRIAQTKSLFVINGSAGAKYLGDILWAHAGIAPGGDWYLDAKVQGPRAVHLAAEKGGYTLFGIPPFLRLKRQARIDLEPLVIDPLFQRIMVAIVVNPKQTSHVNADGARAFEQFLLSPAAQARIRSFRYADFGQQAWWPAGRHNNVRE